MVTEPIYVRVHYEVKWWAWLCIKSYQWAIFIGLVPATYDKINNFTSWLIRHGGLVITVGGQNNGQ